MTLFFIENFVVDYELNKLQASNKLDEVSLKNVLLKQLDQVPENTCVVKVEQSFITDLIKDLDLSYNLRLLDDNIKKEELDTLKVEEQLYLNYYYNSEYIIDFKYFIDNSHTLKNNLDNNLKMFYTMISNLKYPMLIKIDKN